MIRPAATSDAPAIAALLRATYPDALATAAGIAHRMTTAPAVARPLYLTAERAGTIVGYGFAFLDWDSTTPTDGVLRVEVHPEHRGADAGTELFDALWEHLRATGAETVRSAGPDDAVSRTFAERRGFVVTSTNTVLRLDPTTLGSPDQPPPGVAIEPIADMASQREALFAVDYATMQDEPGDDDLGGVTLETWVRGTFEHPDWDPELSTVALVDGALVGLCHLYTDRDTGRGYNGGTGVIESHRGRGIGVALKRSSLTRAAAAGIRSVCTTNDDTNAPMLAINRTLGYQEVATRVSWRRDA